MHDTWTLRRDEEAMAMLLARGQKNIFIPILPKDPTSVDSYKDNVSVAANDRCFGIDPNEDPDHYDDVDAERNALEMIPCLRKGDDGKLWFSSVWLYPRVDWVWEDGAEVEITFMYGWELMPWMKNVQPPFATSEWFAEVQEVALTYLKRCIQLTLTIPPIYIYIYIYIYTPVCVCIYIPPK